jgi:sRNA-binding protein
MEGDGMELTKDRSDAPACTGADVLEQAKMLACTLPAFKQVLGEHGGAPCYLPLAIGAKKEMARFLSERGINPAIAMLVTVRLLGRHVKKAAYARGVLAHAQRCHIDGTPAIGKKGVVTDAHRAFAQQILLDHELRLLDVRAEKAEFAAQKAIEKAMRSAAKKPKTAPVMAQHIPQTADQDGEKFAAPMAVPEQPKTPVVVYRKRRTVFAPGSTNAVS